jgi:hypothetical protein
MVITGVPAANGMLQNKSIRIRWIRPRGCGIIYLMDKNRDEEVATGAQNEEDGA